MGHRFVNETDYKMKREDIRKAVEGNLVNISKSETDIKICFCQSWRVCSEDWLF